MISTRDALFAAILAQPDDDLRRLVFADYLDETGDAADAEYAEFVRWCCAAAKEREFSFGGAIRRWLWRRGSSESVSAAVERVLASLAPPPGIGYVVRRGFVDEVFASSADWLRIGDAITQRHPVQTVRLTTRSPVRVLRAAANGYGHAIFDDDTTIHVDREKILNRVSVVVTAEEMSQYSTHTNDAVAERLCRAHWPRVRNWHLPPRHWPTLLLPPLAR